MSSSANAVGETIGLVLKEGKRRVLFLAGLFSIVALIALPVGLLLPKRWDSSTVILAESSAIIPIMGRTAPTVTDQTAILNQTLMSRRILREVLAFGGWVGPGTKVSPQEEERLLEKLKSRIKIESPRPELVKISYHDTDPQRSYRITTRLAEIYVREGSVAKERESREAFDFLDRRVAEYRDKLAEAHEQVLTQYRSLNPGAAPAPAPTTAAPAQAAPRAPAAPAAPVPRRSAVPPAESRQLEEQYAARVNQLRAELDRLRGTYTEQHPDVIRVTRDLATVTEELRRAQQARMDREKAAAEASALDDAELQAARAKVEGGLRTTSRPRTLAPQPGVAPGTVEQPDPEMRGVGQDTKLSELLRRYEATRDIYQDMLKRRETARLSVDLDTERQGLTLRVQEPAEMPVTASSLRLLHVSAIGLTLAAVVPLGLLFAIVRLDGKVRSPRQIEHQAKVPLLGSIPYAAPPTARNRSRNRGVVAVLMVVGVFAVYVATFLYKLKTSS